MTTDRAERRVERKLESIIPVTCHMLKHIENNNGVFLDGVKCDKFNLVGQIVSTEHVNNNTIHFTIDDGTETIKVTEAAQFMQPDENEGNTKFKDGDYVSIFFDAVSYEGVSEHRSFFFNAIQINRVTDSNQITYHFVKAVLAYRRRRHLNVREPEAKMYHPQSSSHNTANANV